MISRKIRVGTLREYSIFVQKGRETITVLHLLWTNSLGFFIPYKPRGGEWSFKNPGSRKILIEFHGSRSLVFLSVMCVSQSRFL